MLQSAKIIGAGLSAIGMAGAGVGIGIVFNGFLIAVSRNPSLRDSLFSTTIIGFALCEAIALFALMFSFLLLYS